MNIKEFTLSIIVLTHNDEATIVDCLESLDFANEIVLIDDNSSDRTIELARQYTGNIHKRSLGENFASQRNFALNHIHNEWVLFVDSDEIVTESLKEEILEAIKNKNFNGYFLKRIDVMWGKKILHGEAGEVKLLRLARAGHGKWHGKVHEIWRVSGTTGLLKNPLIHSPHQSVREFLREIDDYSTLRAQELNENGTKSSSLTILIYPVTKFFMNYILKRGYKDGVAGFIYAMIMSFHSFLVRSKLFLLQNR